MRIKVIRQCPEGEDESTHWVNCKWIVAETGEIVDSTLEIVITAWTEFHNPAEGYIEI